MRRARALTDRYARSELPVLVSGPTGSGKELFARRVHALSGRTGEFVDVNCGALPAEIIESLLFGHRRGAFTGASEDSIGLIRSAHGGTLFLDELSSLPLAGQAKLLRAIETREVRPLGDGPKRAVDFRLVAAVQDPASDVEAGVLRRDLAYRISGVVIDLACLAERREDIAPLARYFAGVHGCEIDADAFCVLLAHNWPGNVRELRAVVERASVGARTRVLTARAFAEALCHSIGHRPGSAAAALSPAAAELLRVCVASGWDANAAARALRLSRATLYRRLREHGLVLRLSSQSQNLIGTRDW